MSFSLRGYQQDYVLQLNQRKPFDRISIMQGGLWTELSAEELPAEAVDFVPGQFGLQLPVCQSNNPEALPGVDLQRVCEALRD